MNLDQPIPLVIEQKQKPASTKSVQQPCPKLLKEDNRKYNILNKFRCVVGKSYVKLSLDNKWNLILFFSAQEIPLLHNYDTVQWIMVVQVLIFLASLQKAYFYLKI